MIAGWPTLPQRSGTPTGRGHEQGESEERYPGFQPGDERIKGTDHDICAAETILGPQFFYAFDV